MICSDCALFGSHKDHEFMKMNDYRVKISEMIEKFENDLENLDSTFFDKKILEK